MPASSDTVEEMNWMQKKFGVRHSREGGNDEQND
jgi:hypothetical protein